MVRIGLTGGIACGKSLAASFLAEDGVPVCEADELARAVMRRGEAAYDAVVAAFGREMLRADGEIDRERLGRRVFGDASALARLNALVHPDVLRRIRDWVAARAADEAPAVAAVIPLLSEIHDEASWDVVVCVSAPETDQMQRLRARGLSAVEARARLAAQMPQGEKMERADRVLFNCGTPALLREQVKRMMRSIRGD